MIVPRDATAPAATGATTEAEPWEAARNERNAGGGQPGWKGLTRGVLEAAGLTQRAGLVEIPYRSRDGGTHNVRVFASDGQTWWKRKDVALIPFGLETLPPPAVAARSALLIGEGESDALALREADLTVAGADCYVLGLPGAQTWRFEWAEYVTPFALVYCLGDGDEPGQAMNWSVRADVPWARPVRLPGGDDVRGLLQSGNWRVLTACMAEADRLAAFEEALARFTRIDDVDAYLTDVEVRHAA
jgi:hypothetical protein